MSNTERIAFHDGRSIPQLGFGVWQIPDDVVDKVVVSGINLGYRLVDTAHFYYNEAGVGRGIKQSGINRNEIFVTTKLWNSEHGHDLSRAALLQSLETLDLEYIDLYLIHWPVPKVNKYIEAWEALIQLKDEGLIKSIGVCNFNLEHLQNLLDATGVIPVVNQIELHPRFQQQELRQFHKENDIVTQAWSPLGQGNLWNDPSLLAIAQKHNKTVAQVILRWHIQLGNSVIPKSQAVERLRQNMQIFDFKLDATDMELIAELDQVNGRMGPDPELFRLPNNI